MYKYQSMCIIFHSIKVNNIFPHSNLSLSLSLISSWLLLVHTIKTLMMILWLEKIWIQLRFHFNWHSSPMISRNTLNLTQPRFMLYHLNVFFWSWTSMTWCYYNWNEIEYMEIRNYKWKFRHEILPTLQIS